MKIRFLLPLAGWIFATLASPRMAQALFSQQGTKLVGSGAVNLGGVYQGGSVSLSSDGNTAVVGGYADAIGAGAAWFWTRSAGVWTQQGAKRVGSGAVGPAFQGCSVSLSADGNTAIVGGYTDNIAAGAAWIWTRSGGAWHQQGDKLVGSGATGLAFQGYSVALSADGNTAIVGGTFDNNQVGAAWVWTRSAGVWHQQGGKLVGSGGVAQSEQGWSVALSADGNTAIVGGPADNTAVGAAWIWTRSAGVWHQQGSKLLVSDGVGLPQHGSSVSLSADGNTALVGGAGDSSGTGAAWIWTRSGGAWIQHGGKLVGTGFVGNSQQGWSVSLSSDGNSALVGGLGDNNTVGATWSWKKSGAVWAQQGEKLVGAGATGPASQGVSVSVSGDASTAAVGGYIDDTNAGAAWIFAGSASACERRACVGPIGLGVPARSGRRPGN